MAKKPPRLGLAIPALYHFASGFVSNFGRLRHYATRPTILPPFPRCQRFNPSVTVPSHLPICGRQKRPARPCKAIFSQPLRRFNPGYRRNPHRQQIELAAIRQSCSDQRTAAASWRALLGSGALEKALARINAHSAACATAEPLKVPCSCQLVFRADAIADISSRNPRNSGNRGPISGRLKTTGSRLGLVAGPTSKNPNSRPSTV